MSRTGSFVAGLLIGGVVGAGVALLVAPAAGKETRKLIRDKVTEVLNEGKEEVEKVREVVRDELTKLAQSKDALIETVLDKVQNLKSRGETEIPQEEPSVD